ncbi:NAD(P)/FAD-dependent oxidoreductase [Novosphingobium sp.]|uniref:NAD(P)/FAD-dependent oxidoreductase n=1 Tax=Novosphingobium sp. TaxID=1874826 RepID=UPI003B52CF4D
MSQSLRDTQYGTIFWKDSLGEVLPRAALTGDETVDVAILGGGFSGLWTAYFLLRANPGLSVAIIEKHTCGHGASGRNGGWCSPRYPVLVDELERKFGAEAARATILAQYAIIEDIGRICEEEGIDAHFRQGGLLSVARSARQWAGLQATFATYDRLGLAHDVTLIDAAATLAKVRISKVLGGMSTVAGASIHPARLVSGLARAVEARGGRIYEGTAVTAVRPGNLSSGQAAMLETSGGVVTARRAVVMAGEAYLSTVPGWHRQILPMSSVIVATAPLDNATWAAIGWDGYEGISSGAYTKDYLTRTRDGRILFGSRGAPYLFGSKMPESALADPALYGPIIKTLREWFPVLTDVPITHAWGGYLGVPRDGLPSVFFDKARGLANIYGYTGRGVATTALAGRALAGLIGDVPAMVPDLPMIRAPGQLWEIEPARWVGVRYIQNAFARIDAADFRDGSIPFDAGLAKTLAPI